MAIKVLDERHKRFAEMMLTNKPRTMREKADELNVNKSTLFLWAKDPLWQGYYDKLAEDIHQERVHRLTPLVMTACETLAAALENTLESLTSGSADERRKAPALATIAGVTKTLVELERVDHGKPSSIVKREGSEKPMDKASKKLLKKLNDMFGEEEPDEFSETREAPTPEPSPDSKVVH
jgi:hypothetical protein